MSKLSEEEIIDVINTILKYKKVNGIYASVYVVFEAIQGLLDLYQKEKEKNKILELTKIPYLEGEIMAYKENTVSKDKIKEIIYPTPTNPISYEIQTSDMYRKILQLLEEE